MRALSRLTGLLLALGLLTATMAADANEPCGSAVEVPTQQKQVLEPFVRDLRLRHVDAAVGTVSHVHATGRLPNCYLTKRQADEHGWRPGTDLWRVAPGNSIGGDAFGNREGRLPRGTRYVEADLDYAGGGRGPVRLVFVRDSKGRWAQWITIDHYNTFHKVPAQP